MAQEILPQAFPDKATPLVSSGISYTDACVKHVGETFKASRVYIVASASLTKNTSHTDDLKKAQGGEYPNQDDLSHLGVRNPRNSRGL
jgi:hypothetical protein